MLAKYSIVFTAHSSLQKLAMHVRIYTQNSVKLGVYLTYFRVDTHTKVGMHFTP